MKVGTKLLLAFLAIGIVFAVIGLFFLFESRRALSNEAFKHLESVREIKKAQIESFFAEQQDHLQMLLEVVSTFKQNAVQKLKSVQEHQKAQLEWYFQERLNNIDTLSKSELLIQAMNQFHLAFKIADRPVSDMGWYVIKDKLDLELKRYQKVYGYNDLLLMTVKGDIVYTATKPDKLGQNLLNGALKDSPLAKGFKKALKRITVQDFEPYAPRNNQHVAFMTAPIFSSGELIGVLAFCLSPDSINAIVQRREGMGKTEESYLVGAWNEQISYRSNRLIKGKEQCVMGYETRGDDIDKALAGKSGIAIKVNDNRDLELASYAPLQIQGLNWGIITTISLEESITPKLMGEQAQEDFFSRYINHYGYHDLYLIHPDGKIFYTVKHEADYATNILTGKYAESTLGNLSRKVSQSKTFGISDYAPYAPSYNDPYLFVAQPVLSQQGEIELIVALQLSDDILEQVMLKRAGMGKSGETYLVGNDMLMRSNSFLDLDNHSIKASFANPSIGVVDTQSSRAALAGETGEQIINNYLGHSVLSAYTPLKIGNTSWALIAEMNENEAFAALIKLEWLLGIVALLVGFTAAVLIHRFTQHLLTPLLQVNEHLKCLAQGKVVKAGDIICRGKDEIADLKRLAQSKKLVGADDITYQGKDEIAEIIGSFHQLRNSVKSTIEQANAIAAGDYTREVKLLSQQDQLGIALCEMTRTLYSQSQNLQKQQAELRRINEKLEQRVIQRTHQLAQANQKVTALNERLKAENLRMGAELEITRQLQQMVLPKEPELKQIKGLDIAGFMEPADEVGGDYYDVLQHNGCVKIGIGDVTGHGLASGVLMLMVQMAVRTLLTNGMTQPETFLTILNRVIYDNVQRMNSDKNLTLSLLDYQDGVLRLCGQHEEVIVVRQGGDIERIDTFNLGFMVGVEPDIADFVAQKEITLQPGDGVVLYTDGITEARNIDKRQYGVERLCEIVGCHWHQSALEIQLAVIADVRQHIGQQRVYDDITLLVLKQKKASYTVRP